MTEVDRDLRMRAGSQFVDRFDRLGDITTRTALWFAIKRSKADIDTASLVLIEETDGLLCINGAAAAVAANGEIDVDDQARGDLTVILSDAETVKLAETAGKGYYQLKWLDGGGEAHDLRSGRALIVTETVRRVS